MGKEKTYNSLKDFGFAANEKIIGLPGEENSRIDSWEKWREIRFANISFGQGLLVTGLEMLQAYHALINGGMLTRPYIIERTETAQGRIITPPNPSSRDPLLSYQSTQHIKEALQQVVLKGTGSSAKSERYSTAGKTGTSEKFDSKTGTYAKNKRIASFMGFAPFADPHLLVYVVIDEPQEKPYYGGKWAAPVFKEIIEKTLKYLNVKEDMQKKDEKNIENTTISQKKQPQRSL